MLLLDAALVLAAMLCCYRLVNGRTVESELPSRTNAMEVISEFVPLAGARVLDLGCGGGSLARSMLDLGAHVVGVDPNREALALARRTAPTGAFQRAGAEALPFGDGVFEAAVFLNSLHHVPKTVMDPALQEAGRVVKSAGPIVVIEPLAEGSFYDVLRLVEDETEIRAAAQSAIDEALSRGTFEQSACLDYLRRERFEDVERFLVHAVRVDPNRAAIVERRRDEISTAFREYARVDEDGMMVLEQPMRARILKSID